MANFDHFSDDLRFILMILIDFSHNFDKYIVTVRCFSLKEPAPGIFSEKWVFQGGAESSQGVHDFQAPRGCLKSRS